MSGIYIPGVTVPEDNTILLRIFPESDGIYYTEQLDIDEDILNKYFAIHVPEHGRLIDADALFKKARYRMGITPGGIDEVEAFIRATDLLDAPTIIQADKEET